VSFRKSDKPFNVTAFDNFHRYDPNESWVIGHYATAEEAIAAVKSAVESDLRHFWAEVCKQDGGSSTLEQLIDQYNSFAETPIAFDEKNKQIFDTTSYMKERAAAIVLGDGGS
jgi:L-alanine-DL-glutamate epimerase-like enolase superfamily enzyme